MSNELDVQVGQEDADLGERDDDPGHQIDPDIVEQARAQGWRPREESDLPEERWVDAETFVKRGWEIMPILQSNNKRLQAELSKMQAELDTTKLSLKKVQEYHDKLEARAYERAVKDLKAERRAAMEAQDFGAVADLDEEMESLKEEKPAPPAAAAAPSPAPEIDPLLKTWIFKHRAWFNDENPDMVDYANVVGLRIHRTTPELKGQEFLDKIEASVKKQFPEKFGGQRAAPSLVESGRGSGRSGGRASTSFSDLPREAQQACKELGKEEWYQELAKSQKMTTEQLYLRDYEV